MTAEQWERVARLCHEALAWPRDERPRRLDEACRGDAELRREVETLLDGEQTAEVLLRTPEPGALLPSPAATRRRWLVGCTLGPYRVEAPLGAGGMGEVFRAHDTKLGRAVALKILPPDVANDPERLARFDREARILAGLSHPAILTIHDVGVADGIPYVVTELLQGQTLREVLTRRQPSQRQVLTFALQAAHGLSVAHRQGIVHRDLKPENLFLTTDGRLKILDFGLAKRVPHGAPMSFDTRDTRDTVTQPGLMLGTVAYMSPEQVNGRPVDARADVFAFGVVLYELLTGQHPFRRDTLAETLDAILYATPQSPAAIVPSLPPAASGMVQRCLAKARDDRFAEAGELASALEAVLGAAPGAASLQRIEDRSPYPGLRSFTEREAHVFVGRESEVAALWERVRLHRLQGLIGPSGAGKTSFVRAGVVPARPEGWAALVCTPGPSPMRSLGQALIPALASDMDALAKLVAFDDPDLALDLFRRWRSAHAHVLLVVDQFEELFTLNPPAVQSAVAALIGRLAGEADVHVVLSLRDDFLIRCCEQPALAPVLAHLTALLPLSRDALRRAILEPAASLGYRFEPPVLADEMVAAVEEARAALPLLAFAVARLWERRDRERACLTREAYLEIGGVAGALAQHAEETLERIGAEHETTVREYFRNLVTVEGTRAVIDWDELLSVARDPEVGESVLRELVDARLLTSYEVAGTEGKPGHHRVEVAHESLLTAWPRLVRWRTQDEDSAQMRNQVKQAAALWDEKGRTADLLWNGTAYREFDVWRLRYGGALTSVEAAFARAMADHASRRRRLRRVAVTAVIVVLSAVAIAVGLSRQQAVESARLAEASKRLAQAELRFIDDPTEALALATLSLEQADTQEARTFVMKALWDAPPAFDLEGEGASVKFPSFSPDGKWLAAAGHSSDARVWSEDGRGPIVLDGHEVTPRGGNVARWVSNELLVAGPFSVARRVLLWSLPKGERLRTIEFGGQTSWSLGTGGLLARTLEGETGSGQFTLRSWRLPAGEAETLGRADLAKLGASAIRLEPNGANLLYAKGREIFARPLPPGTGADRLFDRLAGEFAAFGSVPDGNTLPDDDQDRLLISDNAGEVRTWRYGDAGPPNRQVLRKPGPPGTWMHPDRTGRWAVGNASQEQQVSLWDLAAWPDTRPLQLRRSGSWYGAQVDVHPNGDWLAASTASFGRLTFWPLRQSYPRIVDGYPPVSRPVAFTPDGKWLVTAWQGAGLRLWPLPGSGEQRGRILDLPRGLWTKLVVEAHGRFVFAVGSEGNAWVVPLDGKPARKLEGFSKDTLMYPAAISPSGRLVASAFSYGQGDKALRVWDVATGESRRFELPEAEAGPGGTASGEAVTGYERGLINLVFESESFLLSAGDGGLRRWNLDSGTHVRVAAAPPGRHLRGAFNGDGRRAVLFDASPTGTDELRSWGAYDTPDGTLRTLKAPLNCPDWGGALDDSGRVAAVGSRDGVVYIQRLDGGEPYLLVGHKGNVDFVAFSPDLRWVATTGEDNTLRLWPMPDLSKPPLHTLPRAELLAKLRSLTNIRAVPDPASAAGYKLEIGPFPGWKDVPTW